MRRFSNDCLYVQLNANCCERDVFIVQPLVPLVRVISVAPLLAQAIHRIRDGESISSLFDA